MCSACEDFQRTVQAALIIQIDFAVARTKNVCTTNKANAMNPLHILEAFLNGDFSSLWPPLAAVFTGAYDEFTDTFKNIRDAFDPIKQLKDYVKSYYDDVAPSQLERIRKDIQNLYNEAKQFGSDVVQDIANAVNQGLATGEVNPTAPDGSLASASVGPSRTCGSGEATPPQRVARAPRRATR